MGARDDGRLEELAKKFHQGFTLRAVVYEIRREYLCSDEYGKCICQMEKSECYSSCLGRAFIDAIRALEQYERHEKLIEAAGKIKDPQTTAGILQAILLSKVDNQQGKYAKALHEAIALLASLPDAEEKRVEDRKEPQ
jgi:hypothetical protein